METRSLVESMTDGEVLAAFGTGVDTANREFDEATRTRVLASELIRARNRLVTYRTLYAAFLEAGQPFMIENLDERSEGGVPAKLVFTGDAGHVLASQERPDVIVWTEPTLLEALARERTIADFFTGVLDEAEPALQAP